MAENRQQRAAALGVDQIISVWETMNDGYPYFAVYYNRNNKYFQYNKDDIEKAKEFLQTNLGVIEEAGDNTLYYLNIYSEPKPNYPNSGMICSFPFRLNAYDGEISGVAANAGGFAKALTDAHAAQLKLVHEIAELKAQNQPLDWFDRAVAILETPGAAQTLVPLLSPLLGSIMGIVNKISGIVPQAAPVGGFPGIAGPNVADTEKEALLDQALDRLEKHGDLLEMMTVLANVADKNPENFQVYFNMIKAQQ